MSDVHYLTVEELIDLLAAFPPATHVKARGLLLEADEVWLHEMCGHQYVQLGSELDE